MSCSIYLVGCILKVLIKMPIIKHMSWPDWHRPTQFTYEPHTILLIHIWTVLVAHDFVSIWGVLLWGICTLRSILWWGIFGIIVYWVRIILLLVFIWHIFCCLWHYHSWKGFNSAIYRDIYLFLLYYLLALIWRLLCHKLSLIRLIWGYHHWEHENEILLGAGSRRHYTQGY